MKRYFENDVAKLWLEDGISHCIYKEGAMLDLAAARIIVSARLALQQGDVYPFLCDVRSTFDVTREGREYMSNEGGEGLSRVALLSKGHVSDMIAAFYLKVQKPKVPTRIFSERTQALRYLQEPH